MKKSASILSQAMSELGRRKSVRKAAASRRNGKKGGWPKGRKRGKKTAVSEGLPEQPDLPQIDDLHRAKIDITRGEESSAFVARMRDAK